MVLTAEDSPTTEADRGSRARLSGVRTRWLFLAVGLFALVAMSPGFWRAGSEFDEGNALTFADRVVHGAVPYRDFEMFYGPAYAYAVAGTFKLLGTSLFAERAVGLVTNLVIVLSVFLLARLWGRAAAIGSSAVALTLVTAAGLATRAEYAALALSLLALLALVESLQRRSGTRGALALAAGISAGCAVLFRLEFAPIELIAATPLLLLQDWRRRLAWGGGFVLAVAPYGIVAAVVGAAKIRRNVDELRATGEARRLPFFAVASDGGRVFVACILVGVLLLTLGLVSRGGASALRARLLAALGLLALAESHIVFWRADVAHVLLFAIPPLSFSPVAGAELSLRWRAPRDRRLVPAWAALAGLAFLASIAAIRGQLHLQLKAATHRAVPSVEHGGRTFRLESAQAARDLQRISDLLGRESRPGQSLFVGPSDLRRTNSNDVFVYYLFPKLVPASFYLELDPPASAADSGLAHDLATADYLVLTKRWNPWNEPNASRRFGSPEPNRVVAQRFCELGRSGSYELLRRCK